MQLNGQIFELTIWDTAGEEKYHALAPIFYRDTDGAIIIYDCTSRETFDRTEKWFHELKENSQIEPRIILVGNKIDLTNKVVSSEDAKEMARKLNVNYFEVSALTGEGIDTIFENITNEIYNWKLQRRELENRKSYASISSSRSKKKLVISSASERYEKRDEDRSSGCPC